MHTFGRYIVHLVSYLCTYNHAILFRWIQIMQSINVHYVPREQMKRLRVTSALISVQILF